MTIEMITKTFNLLEDLAKQGVIKVIVGRPPEEYATCSLSGVFALVPSVNVNGKSNTADAL